MDGGMVGVNKRSAGEVYIFDYYYAQGVGFFNLESGFGCTCPSSLSCWPVILVGLR